MRLLTSHTKGFLEVELLWRAAIILTITAVSASAVVPALRKSRVSQCRCNMIAISHIMHVHRINDPMHRYPSNISEIAGEATVVPICSEGGAYTIKVSDGTLLSQSGQNVPTGQRVIVCSCHDHGAFAPEIDTE